MWTFSEFWHFVHINISFIYTRGHASDFLFKYYDKLQHFLQFCFSIFIIFGGCFLVGVLTSFFHSWFLCMVLKSSCSWYHPLFCVWRARSWLICFNLGGLCDPTPPIFVTVLSSVVGQFVSVLVGSVVLLASVVAYFVCEHMYEVLLCDHVSDFVNAHGGS